MTALQDWRDAQARIARLRTASAFVVERPDRRAANPPPIGVPHSLNITNELATELARRTRERVEDHARVRILPYDPGHRPEPGEIASVPIDDIPGLRDLVEDLASGAAEAYQPQADDRRKLLLYGVSLGQPQSALVCVQKFAKRHLIRQDKVLFLLNANGAYDRLDDSGFAFDLNFDLFISGDHAFALDRSVLESVIGYLDTIRAQARDHALRIVRQLPFANADVFIAACESDVRFGRKATAVVGRPTFARVTAHALRQYATHHGVALPEDGQGRFIFSNATEDRWLLLKLLDDDFLDSVLTQGRYEVNSKRAL